MNNKKHFHFAKFKAAEGLTISFSVKTSGVVRKSYRQNVMDSYSKVHDLPCAKKIWYER